MEYKLCGHDSARKRELDGCWMVGRKWGEGVSQQLDGEKRMRK